MIRRLIERKLTAVEKDLGVSVDYLRHILRVSLRSFFKFAKIMPLAEHRRALPPEPYFVARIVATRDADCGTCVQIEVNQARKAGVSTEILKAVLDRRPADLPGGPADAYRFAEAVVQATGDEEAYRDRLRRRYGEDGLVELALALGVCRVFPITKRALGYARSCADVQIEI